MDFKTQDKIRGGTRPMFSRVRTHMSYANVVATMALVFAMSGGALAATHYLITSTKQIKPSVLASLKGKDGAPGTAGPAGKEGFAGKEGPAGKGEPGKEGPEGKEGKEGKAGAKGKNGKSVIVEAENTGGPSCKEGGASFEVEGSGEKESACNGKEGSPGKEGNIKATLAPGETETGTWSFSYTKTEPEAESELKRVPISFPIPLAAALENEDVHVFAEGETGTGECEGGTAETPSAKPGNLCIYESQITAGAQPLTNFFFTPGGGIGVGPTGALWPVYIEGAPGVEGEGYGSWAVTAK